MLIIVIEFQLKAIKSDCSFATSQTEFPTDTFYQHRIDENYRNLFSKCDLNCTRKYHFICLLISPDFPACNNAEAFIQRFFIRMLFTSNKIIIEMKKIDNGPLWLCVKYRNVLKSFQFFTDFEIWMYIKYILFCQLQCLTGKRIIDLSFWSFSAYWSIIQNGNWILG